MWDKLDILKSIIADPSFYEGDFNRVYGEVLNKDKPIVRRFLKNHLRTKISYEIYNIVLHSWISYLNYLLFKYAMVVNQTLGMIWGLTLFLCCLIILLLVSYFISFSVKRIITFIKIWLQVNKLKESKEK